MQLFLKILSGMVNSVDPDQTAPEEAVEQSDQRLHCLHMLFCQKPWCMKFWTYPSKKENIWD